MVDHIVRLQPKSILDVGAGFGKYGFLAREALDFTAGRFAREDWATRIDGLDAFPYESPLLDWIYDGRLSGDIAEEACSLPSYDLVILGDVLEHLPKEVGLSTISDLLSRSRNVLVSTPVSWFQQEMAGNTFETHRSLWRREDFRAWCYDFDIVAGAAIVVLLAGRDSRRPDALDRRTSDWAYGVPGLKERGSAARLLKQQLRSVLRASGHA